MKVFGLAMRITSLLSQAHSIAQLGPDGHRAAKISFSNAPNVAYFHLYLLQTLPSLPERLHRASPLAYSFSFFYILLSRVMLI